MKKRTGLKEIMRAIIAKHVSQYMKHITRDLAADHDVSTYTTLGDGVKLTYNDSTQNWEFTMEAIMMGNCIYRVLTVNGLLHDSGEVSIMRITDARRGCEVWNLYSGNVTERTADPDRQIEYKAIA